MPPHLHPRSTYTSSLFATSLFASFFVVALPHVLPCPVPHVAYADSNPDATSDGTTRPHRRRKRRCSNADSVGNEEESAAAGGAMGYEKGELARRDSNGVLIMRKRECPVPKPPGLIGEILGLRSSSGTSGGDSDRSSSSCNGGDDGKSSSSRS
ncbi:hypothetical protein F5884DRAFT_858614 [Xylogone sp. PMI_703]|nr:hypothetical protein F5884DRAFT_858614 [Xylogone sp. PMI_703]